MSLVGRVDEDVTRTLRGNCCRGIRASARSASRPLLLLVLRRPTVPGPHVHTADTPTLRLLQLHHHTAPCFSRSCFSAAYQPRDCLDRASPDDHHTALRSALVSYRRHLLAAARVARQDHVRFDNLYSPRMVAKNRKCIHDTIKTENKLLVSVA